MEDSYNNNSREVGSREAERNLLNLLNSRLEKIIEKNRQLQQVNKVLTSQLELKKVELGTSRKYNEDLNSRLGKAIDETGHQQKKIRDLEKQLGQAKSQLKKKENELEQKLDNAESLRSELNSKAKELDNTKKQLHTVTENVRELKGERLALLVTLDDVKKEKEAEKEQLTREIEDREDEIQIKVQEKNNLISYYQHLLDAKVALDNELEMYRSLVEGEESRLGI